MTPLELLAAVIRDNTPASIWDGSPVEGYRRLGNTNRGEIGEEFIRRYLEAHEIEVSNGGRISRTDMTIAGQRYEVKTASLGANGTFQFNHVRLDRAFRYLLCVGFCPQAIVFNAWRKGDLSEGLAGRLVRMAEGQSTTHKLTKRLDEMLPIEDLPQWVLDHRVER